MKKYIVETTEISEQDLVNIISYLRYNLAGDIVADKYVELFSQALKKLEDIAGSMPIIDEKLIKHKFIRKINIKRYTIFYTVDEMKHKAIVLRVGHNFMDCEKYLKDE
jgi:plasmid stabilization system protein ParE